MCFGEAQGLPGLRVRCFMVRPNWVRTQLAETKGQHPMMRKAGPLLVTLVMFGPTSCDTAGGACAGTDSSREGVSRTQKPAELGGAPDRTAGGAAVWDAGEPSRLDGYVRVSPGEFLMGVPQGETPFWYREEYERQHSVKLTRAYWMKVTEVTQTEYAAVMEETAWNPRPASFASCGGDCPVENVSWSDAVAYCNALSAKQGLPECYAWSGGEPTFTGLDCTGYRLPSEAEWEYAARAGTTTGSYAGEVQIEGNAIMSKAARASALEAIAWYAANSVVSYPGGSSCPGRGWERRAGRRRLEDAWGKSSSAGESHDISEAGATLAGSPVVRTR